MRLPPVNFCAFLLLDACVIVDGSNVSSPNHFFSMGRALLTDYDKEIPPFGWLNGPLSMKLQFGVNLRKIVSVDMLEGSIELAFWLRLKWFDPRLLFNGTSLFGDTWDVYKRLPLKVEDIWTPDIIMVDSVRNQFEDFTETMVAIYDNETAQSDGYNIFWSRPGSIKSKCVMDLKLFPFDTQQCDVRFETWIHHSEFITMVPMTRGAISDDELSDGGEDFKLLNITLVPETTGYSESLKWSAIKLRVKIQRYPFYYVVHSVLPEIVLVCLCALTPWLAVKPEHSGGGERMAFGLSLLLTIVATMLFDAERRPLLKVDTWLDQFQSWCISLAVLPIVETAFIMWIHRHHLSTDIVTGVSSRTPHVGLPRFRRKLSHNADEVAQRAWEFAMIFDVIFRHCYPVLILAIFSQKLSQVPEIKEFFTTEANAVLTYMATQIMIVLLVILFLVLVLVASTLFRRFVLCMASEDSACDPPPVDEEAAILDSERATPEDEAGVADEQTQSCADHDSPPWSAVSPSETPRINARSTPVTSTPLKPKKGATL